MRFKTSTNCNVWTLYDADLNKLLKVVGKRKKMNTKRLFDDSKELLLICLTV